MRPTIDTVVTYSGRTRSAVPLALHRAYWSTPPRAAHTACLAAACIAYALSTHHGTAKVRT